MIIRIGQVGLGYWGPNLLRSFQNLPNCEVLSVCDLSDQNLRKIQLLYPSISTTKNFTDLINKTDIDGIVIAVPAKDHFAFAKESLRAGKHVFVEKPLALTTDECQELIDLSEKNNKVLMVGHLLKYHPAIRKVKDYISEGMIGKIRYIYSTRVNLGKIREIENVMWSLATHDVSVILYFLEHINLIGVSAVGESYLQKKICDVAFITLFFESNIMATIHASWLDPHKIRKITVVGDKKMVVYDDMHPNEKVRLYDAGVDYKVNFLNFSQFLSLRFGDVIIPKVEMHEPLQCECQHFCDCIRENIRPLSDGYDGLKVVRVLEGAEKSLSKKGQFIPLQ